MLKTLDLLMRAIQEELSEPSSSGPLEKQRKSVVNVNDCALKKHSIPVAQTLDHGASNAKVTGSIPRECMN